jgi:hypothetical protein
MLFGDAPTGREAPLRRSDPRADPIPRDSAPTRDSEHDPGSIEWFRESIGADGRAVAPRDRTREIVAGSDEVSQLFDAVAGSTASTGKNVTVMGGAIDEMINVDPVSRAQLEIIDTHNTEFYAHEAWKAYEIFKSIMSGGPEAKV